MSKLFDGDSDSDIDIKTNNEFARNYDVWRSKEEISKLKAKYGEEPLQFNDEESSSLSSDDDEEGVEWTDDIDKDFFKTLSCLKNKDPIIYDENVKFFNDNKEDANAPKKGNSKVDKQLILPGYQNNLFLEKEDPIGLSENEEDSVSVRSTSYVEQQKCLNGSLKAVHKNNSKEPDEFWGGILKKRENVNEEADYNKWLELQEENDAELVLKPEKDNTTNSQLNDADEFLRNFILNKKFLNNEQKDYIRDFDEDLSDDEKAIENQEEFEHKYNFRFEEPDQDFIKRYPRTMENSVRRQNEKRKLRRVEMKERKRKEMEEKMRELKKLQELNKKEIEEKIRKLKEITGNNELGFQNDDVDGDFDPEAHDNRMQALFNEEFYQGPESDQKPECPDLIEDLEIENWERWEGKNETNEDGAHCEDDDFNMDCEYDKKVSTEEQKHITNSKSKKKRKRKSKFEEALKKLKPKFDPTDKTFEKYIDEYYKLDCEDIIGDIPCRFKYRKVIPNSFGLTTEEILLAKDRELNKWCSLKKIVQHREENVEKYDQIAYEKKAHNVNLKKKVLTSLFVEKEDNNKDAIAHQQNSAVSSKLNEVKDGIGNVDRLEDKEKRKPNSFDSVKSNTKTPIVKKSKKSNAILADLQTANNVNGKTDNESECGKSQVKKKSNVDLIDTVLKKPGKTTKDVKECSNLVNNDMKETENLGMNKNNKQHRNKIESIKMKFSDQATTKRKRNQSEQNNTKSSKKFKKNINKVTNVGISDARLAAYGINPKKYKNKLKYGNK